MQKSLPTLGLLALLTANTCFGTSPGANSYLGDFNDDGYTNSDDLDIWKAAFDLGSADGDADTDGDTDGSDFLAWQRGNSGNNPISLPEPTTFVLAMHVLMGMLTRRRRNPTHQRRDTVHKPCKPPSRRNRVLTDV